MPTHRATLEQPRSGGEPLLDRYLLEEGRAALWSVQADTWQVTQANAAQSANCERDTHHIANGREPSCQHAL